MVRMIDADELMEHVYRDRLDSRELIAKMIQNAPTVKQDNKMELMCEELKAHIEYSEKTKRFHERRNQSTHICGTVWWNIW